MAETSQFALPLLAGSQAQKHVTVNEALAIMDAVAQLRLTSHTIDSPPSGMDDGATFSIPAGATDAWAAYEGYLAIAVNGGWRYLLPKPGWQAFNEQTGTCQLFDGTEWLDSTLAATPSGTATEFEIVELDHTIDVGTNSTTGFAIPENAIVLGITGRVTTQITGGLNDWSLGVAEDPVRYGSGLGTGLNSYVRGVTAAPVTYYADTPLVLTASGGDFVAGEVRIAIHLMALTPPRAV